MCCTLNETSFCAFELMINVRINCFIFKLNLIGVILTHGVLQMALVEVIWLLLQ